MSRIPRLARLAAFASIVPVFALAGGCIDERRHLGFTTWRSACRASGLSIGPLLDFTLQLLPTAVIGALCGGLLMQLLALRRRHRIHQAREILATHAGCALTMPVGLVLCALAWPLPLMLFADVALAMAGAWLVLWSLHRTTESRVALNP
jgi:hypothetical protein